MRCPWLDRTQCTKIYEKLSQQHNISYGVPQGSILGSILFILYMNEIKTFVSNLNHPTISCTVVSYADDTQLLFCGEFDDLQDIKRYTEVTTEKLIDVFTELILKINITKTACFLFSTKHQRNQIPKEEMSITIRNSKVPFSDSAKNLGLFLDSTMSFKKHITSLYTSIHWKLTYINKCRRDLSFQAKKLLVENCALVKLNYCRELWGQMSRGKIDQIHKLNSFGAKIIFLKNKRDHSSHLIRHLEWLSEEATSNYHLICMFFRVMHEKFNPNVTAPFTPAKNTRSSSRLPLTLPRPNTEFLRHSLIYRGTKLWLELPEELTRPMSSATFKLKIRSYLLAD